MGRVIPFLDGEPFDPEVLANMGAAFDSACAQIDCSRSTLTKEIIAKRIVSKARTGERDVDSLFRSAVWDPKTIEHQERSVG